MALKAEDKKGIDEKDEENLDEQKKDDSQDDTQQQKKIAGSTFYKQKLLQIEKQNKDLRDKLELQETQTLQEKENFKQLWENEKTKREEAEKKNQSLSKTVFNTFKNSAVKEEALKAGILDQAIADLDIIDTSPVEIETTDQGRINVLGAKEFIENLKGNKPHWFKSGNGTVVNNIMSNDISKPKELTPMELVQLQKTDHAAYTKYMHKKLALQK